VLSAHNRDNLEWAARDGIRHDEVRDAELRG
jgi:hypothetical protein